MILTTPASLERRTRRGKGKTPPRPPTNITRAIETLRAGGVAGGEVVWEYVTEDDSCGTGYSQDLLANARAAGYSNGATRLTPAEADAGWRAYAKTASDTAKTTGPGARLHARPGFPSSAHALAPHADLLLLERANDDIGSLAPGIAFMRGAARQYDLAGDVPGARKAWGIDLSLWWGVINGCVQDLPASFHRRVLYLSYIAGASILSIEGCGWVDGAGKAYPLPREVDAMGTFMQARLRPEARGAPDVPVAVVLPPDNGWSERPSWAGAGHGATLWNYANIPGYAQRGAGAVDGLFAAAYPGAGGAFGYSAYPFGQFGANAPSKAHPDAPAASMFARSAIYPQYAPSPDDVWYSRSPTLEWSAFADRNALHAWYQHNGTEGNSGTAVDPSPARPMADSRWGDVLDVLVADDAPTPAGGGWAGALRGYGAVVWCHTALGGAAEAGLLAFARAGGRVVLSAGALARGQARRVAGVALTGRLAAARAWRWGSTTTEESSQEPAVLEALVVAGVGPLPADGSVEVLARTAPEGLPLVVRRAVGKGSVYLCLAPWFEGRGAGGAGGPGLSAAALRLLDAVVAPLAPVSVAEGLPALYWTSTATQGGARVVAAANNAGAAWRGALHVATVGACTQQAVTCEDVRTGAPLACSMAATAASQHAALVPLTIEAFDVAVVKVACT